MTAITGKRLTPFTVRVYLTLSHFGPMRAAALSELLFPHLRAKQAPLGGTLGKLSRCGLVGWSPYDLTYHANRDPEMDRVLTGRGGPGC